MLIVGAISSGVTDVVTVVLWPLFLTHYISALTLSVFVVYFSCDYCDDPVIHQLIYDCPDRFLPPASFV